MMFLRDEDPPILWLDKETPELLAMYKMGQATDQFGPLIRMGKAFQGLTEENLFAMQKQEQEIEQKRYDDEVARGVPNPVPPQKPGTRSISEGRKRRRRQ